MIDDVVIEERLRRMFDVVAGRVAIDGSESTPFVVEAPQRLHRRPRRLVVAAVSLVAIAIASVAVAATLRRGPKAPQIAVTATPTSTTKPTSTSSPDATWCVAISRSQALARGLAYGTVIVDNPSEHAKLVSRAELETKGNPFAGDEPLISTHATFWVVELRRTRATQGPYNWGLVAVDANTGAVVTANEGPSTGPGGVIAEPAAEPPYWDALADHGAECPAP